MSTGLPWVEGVVGEPGPMGFNTFMTHMNEMIKNMATMTGATAGGQASAEMKQIQSMMQAGKVGEGLNPVHPTAATSCR